MNEVVCCSVSQIGFRVVVENSQVINQRDIGENKQRNAKFEVLTVVLLKVHVLWDVTP
jgi:uncharacterized protein YsxB (DUF464 family)